jgi:cytochrome c biogenesis protein CcmG/thiol:disulfide interchange protein DsbE
MSTRHDRPGTRGPRRPKRRALIATVAVAVVAIGAGIGIAVAVGAGDAPTTTAAPSEPGGAAPSAGQQGVGELPDLEFARFRTGETDRLSAYEGRPLVINFWASWCVPCLAELPRFEQVYQQHSDQVEFLGLNLQDSEQSAAKAVAETGLSYPLGVDPQGQLFQALGGFGMPTTLFVAADGTVLERHTGELSADQLVDRLETYEMVRSGT